MGHEELKEVGINVYGHQHRILKAVKERVMNLGSGKMLLVLTNSHTMILKCLVD